MESQVISVRNKEVAEAIAAGLRLWFESDPAIREADDGWTIIVTGIVPESVRLLMNHYSLGSSTAKPAGFDGHSARPTRLSLK